MPRWPHLFLCGSRVSLERMIDMDKKIYEIWLSLACTPDTATFPRLIDKFASAEEIYAATEKQIRSAVGSDSSDCSRLNDKDLSPAEKIYNFCVTKGVGLLSYYDENFPLSLRDIPTPPVLLYYRGKLPNFNEGFYCAVVGTRSISDYGRINAFRLGYDMAKAEAIIVSGMAIGIDGVAMAGALAAGGKTVAILGSGIDVCYPTIHQTLARAIVKEGCVLTEYAPGTKPEKFNFPRRNRIISGLSKVTVVVEGRETSGSMITARHARNQGRRVYAFPGNVGNDGSQATNLLIKNGASLCTGVFDIVRDFENTVKSGLNPFKIPEKRDVNMAEVLSRYKVSAVAPSDDIFRVPYAKKQNMQAKSEKEPNAQSEQPPAKSPIIDEQPQSTTAESAPTLPTFDAALLKLYKKIPMDIECSIESLVDEQTDLRAVMKMLLKLEMSRFVVLIPGDKVKRNLR